MDSRLLVVFEIVMQLTVLFLPCDGSGVVEINIFSIENRCGRLADGALCRNSALKSNDSVSCPALCNTFVEVCLQPFDEKVRQPQTWCPYGNGSSHGHLAISADADNQEGRNSFHKPSIAIPFTFAWPGSMKLFIQIKHRDISTGEEYLMINSSRSVSAPAISFQPDQASPFELIKQNNWHKAKAVHRFPTIGEEISVEYGYRVLCDAGYFGEKCGQSCVPRNNETGHFICDESGHRRCLSGWTNEELMCTKPICKKDCKGTCQKPGECDNCPFGWHGSNCDKCVKFPGCMHGYCIKPYECRCHEKWGGLKCDLDLDYCYHNAPCQNGAECIPHAINNYTCECKPGFTGKNCDIELNPCWNNPCQNFGTCFVVSSHSYQCICDQSHYGSRCEFSVSGRSDTDPCFYRGKIYSHGSSWETDDCRKCKCIDGLYNCTEVLCKLDDCLSPSKPHVRHAYKSDHNVVCPKSQICRVVTPNPFTCLKYPCSQNKMGQCVPSGVVEHEGGRPNLKFCQVEDNDERNVNVVKEVDKPAEVEYSGKVLQELKFCDKFFIKLEPDLLPEGTFPDHVCHAIYVLILKENMVHYNVFCRLIQREPFVHLEIDIVAISDKWTVNGLKAYLMEELKSKYQEKYLLNAISAVYDESFGNPYAKNDQLVQNNDQPEDHWTVSALMEGRWILIYSLPMLAIPIVILFFILINIIRKHGLLKSIDKNNNINCTLDSSDCCSSKMDDQRSYADDPKWNNNYLSQSCTSIVYSPILSHLKMCNLLKNRSVDSTIDKNLTSTVVDDPWPTKEPLYANSDLYATKETASRQKRASILTLDGNNLPSVTVLLKSNSELNV